jgi:hypothetical protein
LWPGNVNQFLLRLPICAGQLANSRKKFQTSTVLPLIGQMLDGVALAMAHRFELLAVAALKRNRASVYHPLLVSIAKDLHRCGFRECVAGFRALFLWTIFLMSQPAYATACQSSGIDGSSNAGSSFSLFWTHEFDRQLNQMNSRFIRLILRTAKQSPKGTERETYPRQPRIVCTPHTP